MDDARQAPSDYTHFDGYSMGPTSDFTVCGREHIPDSTAEVGTMRVTMTSYSDPDARHHRARLTVRRSISTGIRHHCEDARLVQIHRPDGVRMFCSRSGTAYCRCSRSFSHSAMPSRASSSPGSRIQHLGDAASKTDGKDHIRTWGRGSNGISSGMTDRSLGHSRPYTG